jgi:hypothetical protein
VVELFPSQAHEITLVLDFVLLVAHLLDILFVDLLELSLLLLQADIVLNKLIQASLNMKL